MKFLLIFFNPFCISSLYKILTSVLFFIHWHVWIKLIFIQTPTWCFICIFIECLLDALTWQGSYRTILNQSLIGMCAHLSVYQGHTDLIWPPNLISHKRALGSVIDWACCINYNLFSLQRSTSCNINYKIHIKYPLFKRWN